MFVLDEQNYFEKGICPHGSSCFYNANGEMENTSAPRKIVKGSGDGTAEYDHPNMLLSYIPPNMKSAGCSTLT